MVCRLPKSTEARIGSVTKKPRLLSFRNGLYSIFTETFHIGNVGNTRSATYNGIAGLDVTLLYS